MIQIVQVWPLSFRAHRAVLHFDDDVAIQEVTSSCIPACLRHTNVTSAYLAMRAYARLCFLKVT